MWNRVIINHSLNHYFLTLRVLFLSLARNDFSRSRRWSSRRHVGWNFFAYTICNLRIMSRKRLLNAYLLFWSRGPCFRIISRKVGIRFGLGGNIASSQGVLVFNIIVVICANKRLLGSFHHIWKSLFRFALHQHQGTKSEPWIELNIWGEDIMSGNSLSRHIPEQLGLFFSW